MGFSGRILLVTTLLAPVRPLLGAAEPDVQVKRIWLAGQEAGKATERQTTDARGVLLESVESTRLERMGVTIRFEVRQQSLKRPDGSMQFTWSVVMSQEPQEGRAEWSPRDPGRLKLALKDGAPRTVEIPEGALVWPGDLDDRLKAAARAGTGVRARFFSFPTQQWYEVDLQPAGPAPLPGFPDTVRFRGRSSEGAMVEDVDLWISPTQGEVKHQGTMAGVPVLSQRAELPPPGGAEPGPGLFERTVKALPPHPFLLWLPEVRARWTGKTVPELPEDPQQRRLGPGLYLLARAKAPAPAEAAELPVRGRPSPQDAPFLAATPLVQFNDPVFAGLVRRLGAPAGATRWELAQRVTHFVFDWIRDKNYTVGFASAQEVARNPVGACSQHGILAVALLRRLGVPARAATGWIALGETLAVHFWVEAEIGGRWIPLDPTFDQAPASAYRIKLGTSDLADLGSVGASAPGTDYLEGAWVPDGPWTADVRPQGDTLQASDGVTLRVPGAVWTCAGGKLTLAWGGSHRVEAAPRPAEALLVGARKLQGAASGRQGWYQPKGSLLWIDLGAGRWLQVDGVGRDQAFRLLDDLEVAGRAGPPSVSRIPAGEARRAA
jgi:transglutaminase-like putative cysteine protease